MEFCDKRDRRGSTPADESLFEWNLQNIHPLPRKKRASYTTWLSWIVVFIFTINSVLGGLAI
jgi:hypothetical protein